jgi:hypothetical protein
MFGAGHESSGHAKPSAVSTDQKCKMPPHELGHGQTLSSNGSIIVGEAGSFLTLDMYCTRRKLLPIDRSDEETPPEPTLPRGPRQHTEWNRARKAGEQPWPGPITAVGLSKQCTLKITRSGSLDRQTARPRMRSFGPDTATTGHRQHNAL